MIEITVNTTPIAQPRQRHSVITRLGKTFVTNYTPKTHPVTQYKLELQRACCNQYAGDPLEGPLEVKFRFVMPRPKGKFWKTKPMPRERHYGKPDVDNLLKSTADALTGILWTDDSQICAGEIEKWIAAGDEQPHVVVTVRELQ